MSRITRRRFLAEVAAAAATSRAIDRATASPPDGTDRLLESVQAYADAVLDAGCDTYGTVNSPLTAVAIDRRSMKVLEKRPPNLPGIRTGDRVFTGANPMHDLNLYQVLYALGEITGQRRYAEQADKALSWFFNHCQSPKGLMAWGEHQGWDFLTDSPSAPQGPHEFYRPWILADRSAALAPDAFHRFAVGLWRHQIGDHETGGFSRHAMDIWSPEKKSGRTGYEFPRHGGFFIAVWAGDYQRSADPTMLQAIEVLVDSFERRRHPASGAIPSQSTIPELMWPASNLSLAVDLCQAAAKVPEALATKMLACAARTDENYLRLDHEPGPGGRGFVKSAYTSTLEPGDVRADEAGGPKGLRWTPYTRTWTTGYGAPCHAEIAMVSMLRYDQTRIDGYKKLVVDAARSYLTSEPQIEPHSDGDNNAVEPLVYPGALAGAIAVELAAHRLTGDRVFLERAEHFARLSLDAFFDNDSPLPRVGSSPSHTWYEAITRADTLAAVLLDLWACKNRPDLKLDLVWTDR